MKTTIAGLLGSKAFYEILKANQDTGLLTLRGPMGVEFDSSLAKAIQGKYAVVIGERHVTEDGRGLVTYTDANGEPFFKVASESPETAVL